MKFYPIKLSARIPLTVALIIMGITAVFFSWHINREKKEILIQYTINLKENAACLKSAIDLIPDKNINQGILDNFYNQLKRREEDRGEKEKMAFSRSGHEVHLIGLEGIIFASTHKELIGNKMDVIIDDKEKELFKELQEKKKEAFKMMVHQGMKVVTYSLPLFQDRLNPARATGVMHYVEPYSETEERIQEMAIRAIFFALFLFVILFLLIYLLISRKVILPLDNLTRAMKRTGEKGLGGEIKIRSDDEIGALAESFNQMTRNLKKTEKERMRILEELEASRNKLKEYAGRLEDKVKERTKDLIKSMQALKETQQQLIQAGKLSAIGQLAGGVAHEINNPLTGVLNNVQLIKLEAQSQRKFELKEFQELLDIIEESAQRCARITRALLDFSRRGKGEFEPLSINEAIERAFVLGSHELRLEGIEVVRELSPDLPFVLGNFHQLQQVLLNLIANAKNALNDVQGKKKLTLKTFALSDGKAVRIEFSDNGRGISEENLNKIFEPFFTTMDVGKGTGLGLSISYGIIQAHRGNIKVTSREGEGATFTITLPVVKKK